MEYYRQCLNCPLSQTSEMLVIIFKKLNRIAGSESRYVVNFLRDFPRFCTHFRSYTSLLTFGIDGLFDF